MIMEKYTNRKGETWVGIKFLDPSRTEVIMSEDMSKKALQRYVKIGCNINKTKV